MAAKTKQMLVTENEALRAENEALKTENSTLRAELEALRAQQAQPKQAQPQPQPTLAEAMETARKAQAAIQSVARPGIRVWVTPEAGGRFAFQHCPEGQTPKIKRVMSADGLRRLYATYRANAAKEARSLAHLD